MATKDPRLKITPRVTASDDAGPPALSSQLRRPLLMNKGRGTYDPDRLSETIESPIINRRPTLLERWRRMWSWLRKNKYLAVSTVVYFVLGLGNTIYFKKMTNAMPNNTWFLSQVTTLFYVPVFFFLSWWLKEKRTFSMGQACVTGFLDGFSGICMVLGGIHTDGGTQVVLQQFAVPISMMFSMIILKTSYHNFQYMGAGGIILGVAVTKLPSMWTTNSSSATDMDFLFNLIFLMCTIPNGLSGVLKEICFRDTTDLGVNVLQFWVCVFQTFFTVLSGPIYALKILGPTAIDLDQIPSLFRQGWLCFIGINSIVPPNCGNYLLDQHVCDHCQGAGFIVVAYMFFNFGFNVTQMLLVKYGSAAYFFLISAARLPVVSIAFSSPYIMGEDAVPTHITDWIALVLVMIGLFAYRFGETEKKKLDRQRKLRGCSDMDEVIHEVRPFFTAVGPCPVMGNTVDVYKINFVRTPEDIRGSYFARLGLESRTPPYARTPPYTRTPPYSFSSAGSSGGEGQNPQRERLI